MFLLHTSWVPVDFDGIQLMRRPFTQSPQEDGLKPGFSNAAKRQMAEKHRRTAQNDSYVVIDLETTGLNASCDVILEFGAVRVRHGQPVDTFSRLVQNERVVPQTIVELTGINFSPHVRG